MNDRDPRGDLPLPSEDTGDLVDTPPTGETADHLVAREEGVPYVPPMERVVGESPPAHREDEEPLSDDLSARAAAALRASDLVAGDRLQVGAVGSTVYLRGEVESVDVLDELLALLGDVEGVDEVVDETTVRGL